MTNLSERDTRIFAEVQADDLSFAIANKLTDVSSNLQIPIVTVLTEKDNSKNEAVVTISHSDPGIDAELLPKLYSNLFQSQNKVRGWGLS